MSRCFPFPPPGYEKKITIDDTGLLKEEKRKDKRHKKDKQKRDRDSDRSREKNKERKERKEKRKDKDRNRRDKQEDKIPNENRIEQQGYFSAENPGSKSLQNNGIRDCKHVQELGRRIGNADSAAGSQMVQKIDDAKKRKAEQLSALENANGNHTENKGKPKDKMGGGRRFNGCRDHFEARCLENANGEFFLGMAQKIFDGISAFKEHNLEQHLDGKDKKKSKESGKSDKQKGRHQEKTGIPICESWKKEKKKEEKAKEVSGQSNDHLKLKETSVGLKEGGKDSIDSCNFKPPDLLKRSDNSPVGEGNVGKHKNMELNGFLHDAFVIEEVNKRDVVLDGPIPNYIFLGAIVGNGFRSNKLMRPISSLSVVENEKKLEPCPTAFRLTSEEGPVHSQRVDVEEHGIDCVVKDQGPNVSSTRSSSAVLAVHSNGDASPHPDSKYLSQILFVPKVEWSDFDDQEWLFSSDHLPSKEPKVACNLVDRTPRVWADALKLDYADVTALPYVIPY